MWGSWVGALVGLITAILTVINGRFLWLNPISWFFWDIQELGWLLAFPTTPIIFFLLGWAIHSLIRRAKN